MNSPRGESNFKWKQWLAALAASSPMLGVHLDVVWCSEMELFQGTNGWLFVKPILIIIGAIIGAIIADKFGRKQSFIAMLILVISALVYVFVYVYFDLPILTILSFIPFGSGIMCVLIALYISEISGPNNCGNLMVVPLVVHCFRLFLIYTPNAIDPNSWTQIITLTTVFALSMLFHFITICVCPETPQYLNWKKRYHERNKSLAFFKGINQVGIEQDSSNQSTNQSGDVGLQQLGCCGKIREIFKFENRRNIAIIFSLITIRRASGQDMNFKILYQKADSSYSSYYTESNPFPLIGLCISLFLFSIIVMLTIRLLAKKLSLLFVIAVHFIATIMGVIEIETYWAIAGVFYAQYLCQIILIAVTLAYIGDFFPINIRAIAIALLIIFEVLTRSIFTLIYFPTFVDVRQLDSSFVNYMDAVLALFKCGVIVSGFFFVLIFFPKSKKKTPWSKITFETLSNEEYLRVQGSAPCLAN